ARFALIVLTVISLAALAQGSTRFPVVGESAQPPMRQMLDALIGPDAAVHGAIENLIRSHSATRVIGLSDDSRRPLLFLNSFICHERSRKLERRLVESIVTLLKRGKPFDSSRVEGAVDDIAKRPAVVGGRLVEFSREQLTAVKAAINSRLGLISG